VKTAFLLGEGRGNSGDYNWEGSSKGGKRDMVGLTKGISLTNRVNSEMRRGRKSWSTGRGEGASQFICLRLKGTITLHSRHKRGGSRSGGRELGSFGKKEGQRFIEDKLRKGCGFWTGTEKTLRMTRDSPQQVGGYWREVGSMWVMLGRAN